MALMQIKNDFKTYSLEHNKDCNVRSAIKSGYKKLRIETKIKQKLYSMPFKGYINT